MIRKLQSILSVVSFVIKHFLSKVDTYIHSGGKVPISLYVVGYVVLPFVAFGVIGVWFCFEWPITILFVSLLKGLNN